jgi:hypothetical protein
MTAAFASFLLLSLVLAGAVAFASERMRPRLKWLLIFSLLLAWGALGMAVAQIVSRTASTLVTPGGARQPHLVEQAAREGLMLLASLGGPALVATALGWLALKASRPGRRQAPPG